MEESEASAPLAFPRPNPPGNIQPGWRTLPRGQGRLTRSRFASNSQAGTQILQARHPRTRESLMVPLRVDRASHSTRRAVLSTSLHILRHNHTSFPARFRANGFALGSRSINIPPFPPARVG
jgi:hypothetical protein